VRYFSSSIRMAREAGMESLELLSRFQLTTAMALGGSPEPTAPAIEALEITEALRESWMRSHSLWSLALAHFVRGDLDRAEVLGREAIAIEQDFDDGIGTCLMLEVLAWTSAAQRSSERASALLGAASAQWRRIGSRIDAFGPGLAGMHEAAETGLRSSLGSRSFERRQAVGARLDLHGAIELALAVRETHDAPLSAREFDVAYGIHRGLSNREIAAELVLSTRTVDTHVQRVLAKLGFTSRAQIAAWVEARGASDGP